MLINLKKIFPIFNYIFILEIFSLFGYLFPEFRQYSFIIIALLFLIISLKDFRLGILVLITELIIGSKGYLFYLEYEGVVISIRIAFWLIIMAVWFSKYVVSFLKRKGDNFHLRSLVPAYIKFTKSKNLFFYLFIFLFFIGWGFINGLLNNNGFNNIFFDFNGWLFFALILPFSYFFKLSPLKNFSSHLDAVSAIFFTGVSWLCIKTFFLLFVFSHNMQGMTYELYRWVRTTGVGEITVMQGGFHRIFFQSHIFIIIAFFIIISIILKNISLKNKILIKQNFFLFSILCILISNILITFSRSFWVGTIAGVLFYYFIILFIEKSGWKVWLKLNLILLLSALLSIIVIVGIVKFPYPSPLGGFNTTSLISERAKQFSGEAGVSSRWVLLPELWKEIKKEPILGHGFGTTITYITQDPRALESSATGEYTTYAFEWGWLDIWLKLGILGLLSYLCLISILIIRSIKSKNIFYLSLGVGLFSMSIISIFSPYMNHPLGIGFLIVYLLLFNNYIRD